MFKGWFLDINLVSIILLGKTLCNKKHHTVMLSIYHTGSFKLEVRRYFNEINRH